MREPLLTNRLILRDITEADAELLLETLDSDPEVMRLYRRAAGARRVVVPRPQPDRAR